MSRDEQMRVILPIMQNFSIKEYGVFYIYIVCTLKDLPSLGQSAPKIRALTIISGSILEGSSFTKIGENKDSQSFLILDQ
jgi:hypothetical protein